MLAKKNRISKSKDIDFTYKTRFQYKTELVRLFLRRNNTENFKLLIVISKKILNKSTDRNTLRRRISSIFENLKFYNRLPPSTSLIIQVNSQNLWFKKRDQIQEHILPAVAILFKKLTSSQNQNKN